MLNKKQLKELAKTPAKTDEATLITIALLLHEIKDGLKKLSEPAPEVKTSDKNRTNRPSGKKA